MFNINCHGELAESIHVFYFFCCPHQSIQHLLFNIQISFLSMVGVLTNPFKICYLTFKFHFRISIFVHGWCPHQSIKNFYSIFKFHFLISNFEFRIPHFFYSHSIVAGGLLLISYTTRLMPFTSLIMRFDTCAKNSCGKWQKSAVIPSTEVTARKQTAFS